MGVKDNFYLLIFYESSLLFIFFMKNEHFKYEDSKPLKVSILRFIQRMFFFCVYTHIHVHVVCICVHVHRLSVCM